MTRNLRIHTEKPRDLVNHVGHVIRHSLCVRRQLKVSVDVTTTHRTATETREADDTDAAVATRKQHSVDGRVLAHDAQRWLFVALWLRLAINVSTSAVVAGVCHEHGLGKKSATNKCATQPVCITKPWNSAH